MEFASGIRIRSEIHQRITLILISLFAFTIPVDDRLSVYVMVIYLIHWIVEGNFYGKVRTLSEPGPNRRILLFSLLFIAYAAGMAWTSNRASGGESLQVKLAVFFFPFFIAMVHPGVFSPKNTRWISASFVAGCLFTCLTSLVLAWIRYRFSQEYGEFFYTRLAVTKHPTYLSMFILWSMALAGFYLASRSGKIPFRITAGILVLQAIFFNFIFLLSSRAGMLGLPVLTGFVSAFLFFRMHKRIAGLSVMLAGMAFYILLFQLYGFSAARMERAGEVMTGKAKMGPQVKESAATRIMLWKTALDEIREHPLAGTGTGDVMDDLMRRYEARQFLYALNNRLNPHNQYLHTWLATGLAGLLILLGCLVIPAVMAVRRSCYLYVFFLFLVGFNFLFESMLERQSGVVFYAFFNALLYKTMLRL